MWDLGLNAAVPPAGELTRTSFDSTRSRTAGERMRLRIGLASASYIRAGRLASRPAARCPMYDTIQEKPVSESATETRLWLAVVTDAVQDWMHGPLRVRREAEEYLFHDERDFPELCERAGLNASLLRAKLMRARDRAV